VRIIKYFIIVIILVVAIVTYPSYLLINSYINDRTIVSPLPEYLTKTFPQVLGIYEVWRPNTKKVIENISHTPEIVSIGAISYDLTTDTLLYEKNIEKKMPMASITKIMTAIVALENSKLEEKYKVSNKALTVGENSMGLTAGEVLNLKELLYGLILLSGNDAAETLAEGSKFGRDNFVYLMNKKAEDLSLSNTHFTNPTGLEGDGNQYSTPHDLLVITKYALKNPTFAKIVSTVNHEIPYTTNHKAFYLYNETNLMTSYPGVKGVKTGYTFEAGLCLVTYLEYEGHKIIAILLNAQNRRQEMKDLLDYSLESLGAKPPPHS